MTFLLFKESNIAFSVYSAYTKYISLNQGHLIYQNKFWLLSDRFKLTSEQIQQRWKDFGINSPCFMNSLEIVANGDPDLCRFINFIKTPPTGGDFMEFLNQNSTNLKNVLEYNPEYLSFIPKKIPGDLNIHSLITEEEYEQVNLI